MSHRKELMLIGYLEMRMRISLAMCLSVLAVIGSFLTNNSDTAVTVVLESGRHAFSEPI